MSILFRDRPPRTEKRDTISLSQLAQIVSANNSGLSYSVDGDSSMRHDAVWSCRTRIAQDVSMYPVDVFRQQAGRKVAVDPTPQIVAAPSVHVSALDWRYQLVDSWLGWGNAYGQVTATTANGLYPLRIELLPPQNVTARRLPGDRLRWFVDNVEHELWPLGDLWHVPAYTLPGSPVGLSPIQYHAATISGSLNAAKFGSDFFTGGGLPSAILTVDPPPADATEAKRLKDRLLEITRGNREPLVLPKGTEYKQISVNPTDSQFIDTQRYSVEQICRIYGEDPVDHGGASGEGSVTYSNRLDARLSRIERRQFWITKVQTALTDLVPRPQFVRLNVNASLMMTPKERHELHKLRLDSRTTSVNRVLDIEDEEQFLGDEFDQPGIPPMSPTPTEGGATDE